MAFAPPRRKALCSYEVAKKLTGAKALYLVYRGAVPRTEAGVDHERGTIADNVADIRHQGDAVIWDDVDVGRDRPEPFNPDDRRRWRLCHKRQRRPDDCQDRDDARGLAHGTSHSE